MKKDAKNNAPENAFFFVPCKIIYVSLNIVFTGCEIILIGDETVFWVRKIRALKDLYRN